jgi:hypothetical protein
MFMQSLKRQQNNTKTKKIRINKSILNCFSVVFFLSLEYEQQDKDSLLQWNPNFGAVSTDARKNSTTGSGFHNRVVAAFRRLLGCCFGKT